ncbi:MAG TPA: 3D domain-containing protein [Thermodesulfovibrionia bacterium]|nr:3D domain-containing protein [Thermodesulfovibrionia bacterium]
MYMNRVSFGMLLIFLIIFSIGPAIANNHLAKDNRLGTENTINQKTMAMKEGSVYSDCFQEDFNKSVTNSLLNSEDSSPQADSGQKDGCKLVMGADGQYAKVNCQADKAVRKEEPAKAKKAAASVKSGGKNKKGAAKKCTMPEDEGKFVIVHATAYTDLVNKKMCRSRTALNTKPRWGIVAVDPRLIPLGSKIYIKNMGWFTAEDTGGSVKGKRIDIYYPTKREALRFGAKRLHIKVIPKKRKNYKL